jgi:general secretion pathway protein A
VRHRLAVAGGEGKVTFTSQALQLVHRRSGGVPRLVNLICDRALLAGYVRGSRTIVTEMVQQAAGEVLAATSVPLRWRHGLIGTALTIGLALLAFALSPRAARAPAQEAPLQAGTPAAAAPADRPQAPSARLDSFLRTADRGKSYEQALSALARAWGGRELNHTALRTHLGQLRAFDLPAVLEMFHPSRRDTCFIALLELGERSARVAAGDAAESVPLSQVEALWTRDAVLAWPEDAAQRSDRASQAAWARGLLSSQGYSDGDFATAVRRFQVDAHLVSDGLLGPRTRMALFARTSAARPRLTGDGAEGAQR